MKMPRTRPRRCSGDAADVRGARLAAQREVSSTCSGESLMRAERAISTPVGIPAGSARPQPRSLARMRRVRLARAPRFSSMVGMERLAANPATSWICLNSRCRAAAAAIREHRRRRAESRIASRSRLACNAPRPTDRIGVRPKRDVLVLPHGASTRPGHLGPFTLTTISSRSRAPHRSRGTLRRAGEALWLMTPSK